jgi:hypothetical protein
MSNTLYMALERSAAKMTLLGLSEEAAFDAAVSKLAAVVLHAADHQASFIHWSAETTWDDWAQALLDAAQVHAPEMVGDLFELTSTHFFKVHMPRAFDIVGIPSRKA